MTASPAPARISKLRSFFCALLLLAGLPAIGQAATVELLDRWGNPTTEFDFVFPMKWRVTDETVGTAGEVDLVSLQLSAPTGDLETLICRETGRTSGVFEGEMLAYDYGGSYPNSDGLQLQGGDVATATYSPGYPPGSGGTFTAQGTARRERLAILGASGAPVSTLPEGGILRLELIALVESHLYSRDIVQVEVSRSGGDTEIVDLLETGDYTGIFTGSLPLAKNGQSGPGVLDSGPLPAVISVTYERAIYPFATVVASADVVAGLIEIVDAFGQPASQLAGELRMRLTEPYFADQLTGWRMVQVSDDVSQDVEQIRFYAVSEGVFESPAVPLADLLVSQNDGFLAAPAGSTVSVLYTAPQGPGQTFSFPVAAASIELIDGTGRPAASFLAHQPVGVEVRYAAGNVSSGRDTVAAEIFTDLAADSETLVLTETTGSSGIFRGSLAAVYSYFGTAGNGVLEEGKLVEPAGTTFDRLHASFLGAADEAPLAGLAKIELLAGGQPAASFGSGALMTVRITDFSIPDDQGSIDLAEAVASCDFAQDLENLLLRENGGASHVFEGSAVVEVGSELADNQQIECSFPRPLGVRYFDVSGTPIEATAELAGSSIAFVDAAGNPTAQVLDGRNVRVRVTGSLWNGDPQALDQVEATVASQHTGDAETVLLRETTVASGVFEAEVWISSRSTLPGQVAVALGNPPSYVHDTLTATFEDSSASAEVATARLRVVDSEWRDLSSVTEDTTVEVLLEMPSFGTPGDRDLVMGEFHLPSSGLQPLQLYETAADSGIFHGGLWLGNFPVSPGDLLAVLYTTPSEVLYRALPVVTYSARFLDPAGATTTSLPPGRPLRVELVRPRQLDQPWEIEQIEVQLRTANSDDFEPLVLTETMAWSATFVGTLPLQLAAVAAPFDGVVEVAAGFPFGDTVRVELAGAGTLASASLREPRIRFLDAAGNEPAQLQRYLPYQVEVDDPAFDLSPAAADSLTASLLSLDNSVFYLRDTLALHEIGRAGGLFRGGLTLVENPQQCPFSGLCLVASPGHTLMARHTFAGGGGVAESIRVVGSQTLGLVDEQGEVVDEVLEGAPIRVRLVDSDHWAYGVESRTVLVASRLGGDLETLVLWETSAASGVFERSLPTRYLAPGVAGAASDGVLTVSADPLSNVATGEAVLLRYSPVTEGAAVDAAVPTVAARLTVLDHGGRPAVAVMTGYQNFPILRLECPSLAAAGQQAVFEVMSNAGDSETFTASGSAGGVFTVEVPIGDYYNYPGDGSIYVYPGALVEFKYTLANGHSGVLVVTLPTAGAVLRFVDPATGEALDSTPDLRPFKVRLTERPNYSWDIEQRSVTLSSELAGDLEPLVLTETGNDSGVFEAVVEPRLSPYAQQSSGVFEVGRLPSAFGGIYDVATVAMQMPDGVFAADLPLSGPRVLFTDAQGEGVEEIHFGELAHVLIDDPLLDQDPGAVDTATVTVAETAASSEPLTLTETGPHTGIFRGSLPVIEDLATAGNGLLEPIADSAARLIYQMPGGCGSIAREARVSGLQLLFVDADGNPVETYLEGATLRLQLRSSSAGWSPTYAEQVQVTVRALYWSGDIETVTLLETTATSRIFEGILPSSLDPAVASGNGILEIARGATAETVLATWGHASAQVGFIAGSLRFLDRLGREIVQLGTDNQQLGVELTKLSGTDPGQVDTLPGAVLLEHVGDPFVYDAENLTLTETGPATGIFRGFLPTGWDTTGPGDGRLRVSPYGSHVRARFDDGGGPLEATLGILYDQAPHAEADFTELAAGSSITLAVLLNDTDPEGTPLLLGAAFGGNGTSAAVHPDGTLTITAAPEAFGYDLVTYLVSDAAGSISEGQVYVFLRSPPVLTILGPEPGTVFGVQGSIELTASAIDADDGDLSYLINWSSDLQEYFGTGSPNVVPPMHAMPGTHHLTVSVTDFQGNTASTTLTIVVDGEPTLEITYPGENDWLLQEGANTLTATVADAEEGDLGAAVAWTSSVEGDLGSGTSLPVFLHRGYHELTATVTDSARNFVAVTRYVQVNGRPTITLDAPADGVTLPQAHYLEAHATVGDPDNEELTIEWILDGEVVSTGPWPSAALEDVTPGAHVLTARVTDHHEGEASASASFTVVAAPTLAITAPEDYELYSQGAEVVFAATASDFEDGDLSAEIVWSSDLDGQIGTGATFSTSALSRGGHTVTASVVDGDGQPASATVHVEVQAAPTVSISSPADGSSFPVGAEVILHGSAADLEEGNLSGEIVWSSSRDGALGTGASVVTSALSAGGHTITASITDSRGASTTATVAITIASNTAPTLSITAPASGGTVTQGATVTFTATAGDTEDGNLSAQIAWSSSRDGALGTGATVATAALSVGSHLITASVTDSEGSPASATVTFTITANTAPVVAISSPTSGVWVAVGDSVTFTGSAADAESGDLSATLAWSSSLAGALGSGPSVTTGALGLGSHTITATVADPLGLAGSATITVVVKVVSTATFVSAGALDGFVLESGENTNAGGLASNGQLRLGDNLADRQYRSILSFDTSALPDTLVIRKVTVKAQRSGTTGTNPATTHGTLSADVKTGFFGASTALENADYQDAATAAGTCVITPGTATGQWSTGIFDAAGRAAISLDATTQVRLQFSLDDDDDATNDYLDHYGGESTVASTRPQLVVEYLQ